MLIVERLIDMRACPRAVKWVAERLDSSPEDLWRGCADGSWLLWIAAALSKMPSPCDNEGLHQLAVLAACDCTRTVLHVVPDGEDLPVRAIGTAEDWARGDATEDDCWAVYADMRQCVWRAHELAPRNAILAAQGTVRAVVCATRAGDARDAGECVAQASPPGTWAAVRAQCADLVRARIPFSAVEAAWSSAC